MVRPWTESSCCTARGADGLSSDTVSLPYLAPSAGKAVRCTVTLCRQTVLCSICHQPAALGVVLLTANCFFSFKRGRKGFGGCGFLPTIWDFRAAVCNTAVQGSLTLFCSDGATKRPLLWSVNPHPPGVPLADCVQPEQDSIVWAAWEKWGRERRGDAMLQSRRAGSFSQKPVPPWRLHTSLTFKKGSKLAETQVIVFHETECWNKWSSIIVLEPIQGSEKPENPRAGTEDWRRGHALSAVAAAGIKKCQDSCKSDLAL